MFAGPVIFAPPQLGAIAVALDKWVATRSEKEAIFLALTRSPDNKVCFWLLKEHFSLLTDYVLALYCRFSFLQRFRGRGQRGIQIPI